TGTPPPTGTRTRTIPSSDRSSRARTGGGATPTTSSSRSKELRLPRRTPEAPAPRPSRLAAPLQRFGREGQVGVDHEQLSGELVDRGAGRRRGSRDERSDQPGEQGHGRSEAP